MNHLMGSFERLQTVTYSDVDDIVILVVTILSAEFLLPKLSKPSLTSYMSHQHILSPTSVTNIDLTNLNFQLTSWRRGQHLNFDGEFVRNLVQSSKNRHTTEKSWMIGKTVPTNVTFEFCVSPNSSWHSRYTHQIDWLFMIFIILIIIGFYKNQQFLKSWQKWQKVQKWYFKQSFWF